MSRILGHMAPVHGCHPCPDTAREEISTELYGGPIEARDQTEIVFFMERESPFFAVQGLGERACPNAFDGEGAARFIQKREVKTAIREPRLHLPGPHPTYESRPEMLRWKGEQNLSVGMHDVDPTDGAALLLHPTPEVLLCPSMIYHHSKCTRLPVPKNPTEMPTDAFGSGTRG